MTGWRHHRWKGAKHGGHLAGPAASADTPVSLEQKARRLRERLQEMGPLYSCFALYLSSRVDVLPAEYCRELALTPDSAPALAPAEVEKLLRQELGVQLEGAFAGIDFTAEETALIGQRHRARLRTGGDVSVMVLRPCFHSLQAPHRSSFLLDPEAIEQIDSGLLTLDVFADFEACLRRKVNFTLAREGMDLMARDAASSAALLAHRSYGELCTSRVLTFASSQSQTLEEVVRHRVRGADALARRICYAWLQLALRGHCFPIDPHMRNILVGEGNRIAFLGCDFITLSNGPKENLSGYFDALLSDDPDRAGACLLREMQPARSGRLDVESLRSNLRQAAYFGMLEPVLGTDSNAIAPIVFQHCKTAREHHYLPKAHLLCFYRGLFSIARAARQVHQQGDAVREGLEELRTHSAFDQLAGIVDWRYWFQNSDKFAAAMVQMPRIFDAALTRASSPAIDPAPHQRSAGAPSGRRSLQENLILLLVLAVLISQFSSAPGWAGKAVPLALMLAGLLALRNG